MPLLLLLLADAGARLAPLTTRRRKTLHVLAHVPWLTAALVVAACDSPMPADPQPDARGPSLPDAAAAVADAADVRDAPEPCDIRTVTGYQALDPTHGTPSVALRRRMELTQVALDPQGRLVLLLDEVRTDGTGEVISRALVRLRADGSLDDSFGEQGWVDVDLRESRIRTYALAVDAAGRIYLTSRPGDFRTQVRRFADDGANDPSFGTAGDGSVEVDHYSNSGSVLTAVGTSVVYASGTATRLGERGDVIGTMGIPAGVVRAVAGDESITYLGSSGSQLSVAAFAADGQPVATFGKDGVAPIAPVSLNPGGVSHLVPRRDGGVDVVTDDNGFWYTRLTNRGEVDARYGDAGRVGLGIFPIGAAHRCDGVDVVYGSSGGYGVVATITLDAEGSRSSQTFDAPWPITGWPLTPWQVFDSATGGIVLVHQPQTPGEPGSTVIHTARLMP